MRKKKKKKKRERKREKKREREEEGYLGGGLRRGSCEGGGLRKTELSEAMWQMSSSRR